MDDLRRVAPDAKWVRAESYHVTLKFIGEWRSDVAEVIEALRKIEAPPVDLAIRGNGFFPTPRSPRVFWVGIESDECGNGCPRPVERSEASRTTLSLLASKIDEATSALGSEKEARDFSPHLTLGRPGSGSPRPRHHEPVASGMKRLAERIATMPPPDFGTIHATEFFLYESKLSPGGAKYTKLKSFALANGSR